MKRLFALFSVFFLSVSLFAFSQADITCMTLENGLSVYLLEDSASPTVRLELCVNAGFTEQTEQNAGFFTLYARLLDGEITNDSVRFVSQVAPNAAEKALSLLSTKLKPLNAPDAELDALVKKMNAEFAEYEKSPTGYINTAIDAKLFPTAPWTRESGVPPAEFAASPRDEIREKLRFIAENYYVPSNASLFINGNLTKTAAVSLVKTYFSHFSAFTRPRRTNEVSDYIATSIADGKWAQQKKFVLAHPDFSDEMTQIVLQYTSLQNDEADVLASTWNKDGSAFKKLLLKQRNLKILGDEYIDVSSAQEKSASRLIIQSLLGHAKVSPVIQAELFLQMSRDEDIFSAKDLKNSLKQYKTEFARLSESSDATIEQLSKTIPLCKTDDAVSFFFAKNERLSAITISDIQQHITAEMPFVFVLLNTATYQKYAQEFKNAGYEVIAQKSSPWYAQAAYKNAISQVAKKNEEKSHLLEEIADSAHRFVSKNRAEFSSLTLKNGIPVTIKRSPSSNTAVLSLTIAGGELLFTDTVPGLSSVLSDAIAVNIKNQLDLFAANGAVNGFYEVGAQTLSTHSIITVSCLSKEIDFAIQAAYTALVYCDISPALADGVTYDERTQWRLKTGSAEFQLLCEAIRILYDGTEYPKLYNDTEDKPAESLNFMRIQEAYPILLDATRFSLVLSGGLKEDEKLQKSLDASFGLLGSISETKSTDLALPRPDFSKRALSEERVSLRHLFLTDISKDKAGPRPAILVPTTKFLDPVLYCLSSPDLATTDCALFNALLLELASRLEARLSANYPETKVKAQLPENDMPFARIVVTNVEHTAEVDSAYEACIASLKADLSAQIEIQTAGVIDLEKSELLTRLENGWLMAVISQAGSQDGTAKLIQIGEIQKNARLYLDQYEAIDKAKGEDYFLIAESYFDSAAPLRLYSKDSKK